MSTARRRGRTAAVALVLAAPAVVGILIAPAVEGAVGALVVKGVTAVEFGFPRHDPGQNEDCWGPDMMDPACWEDGAPNSGPGYWGPGMMGSDQWGPGMMGSGRWDQGYDSG